MDKYILDLWNKLPAPLRNRYFLTAVAFVAFMVFVDRHDILTQIHLQRTVNKLENDKVFYEGEIEMEEEKRLDMEINEERFAREQYYMQRNNEDVFIITDE
ncbi:MAG: hypothetical protein AAFO03_17605 [Bacteroidota bacterium]